MYRIILSTAFALFFTTGPSFSQVIMGEVQMKNACEAYAKSRSWYRGHNINVKLNGEFGARIFSFQVIATKGAVKQYRCIVKQNGYIVSSFDAQ